MEEYYCSILRKEEKKIYKRIVGILKDYSKTKNGKIIINLDTEEASEKIKERIDYILTAIRKDHPELFYVNFDDYSINIINGRIIIELKSFYNKQSIIKIRNEIDLIRKTIIEKLKGSTKKQTEINIYKYLQENINYKKRKEGGGHTIASALIEKKGNCEAIAHAFNFLCRELGIPCITVFGNFKQPISGEGGPHAWNMVQITKEKKGIKCIDVSLDLNTNSWSYFNLSPIEMAIDHVPNDLIPESR